MTLPSDSFFSENTSNALADAGDFNDQTELREALETERDAHFARPVDDDDEDPFAGEAFMYEDEPEDRHLDAVYEDRFEFEHDCAPEFFGGE